MATVHLQALRKTYPGTHEETIKGVDCDIADGEFLVMLGPSGCGKSTLLRMVAGLETITEGSLQIAGQRVNDLEPKARNIAMVFQNYALYPHMSVFDNMAYGLKISGLPRAEIRSKVEDAAAILELTPYLARKPRALSGGQRQRVAMGRAIVRNPQVFLFDEPLSNLDAKLRTQMRVEIKRLQQRLGVTALYVTHDQVEAMTLADRIMVLNGGVAEQIATPIDIYEKPASRFVAAFIGAPAMNLLDGKISSEQGAIRLSDHIKTDLPLAPAGQIGRAISLGIRPEHLSLAGPEANGSANGAGHARFDGQVVVIERLGADTLVHAGLQGIDNPIIARLPGHARLEPGDAVTLEAETGNIHLFDLETGKAIDRPLVE